MFNLTVAQAHTFYVGSQGWLVHNCGPSADEIIAQLSKDGKLPDGFITKEEAEKLGWDPKKGNLEQVAPGKSIGGDVFKNKEGKLPSAPGRTWYEAYAGYAGGYRGTERVVYSSDGFIYKTSDHYKTFTQVK